MDEENSKYEKIVELLKQKPPVHPDPERLTERVMRNIRNERTRVSVPEMVYEFIFGWIYIGWMRRIMVSAAMALVIFFGIQQAVILKRINALSGQVYAGSSSVKTSMKDDFSDKLRIVKLFGSKAAAGKISISEKDIDRFIESVRDVEKEYKDILEIINNDPGLKKYFDEKISKSEEAKSKI